MSRPYARSPRRPQTHVRVAETLKALFWMPPDWMIPTTARASCIVFQFWQTTSLMQCVLLGNVGHSPPNCPQVERMMCPRLGQSQYCRLALHHLRRLGKHVPCLQPKPVRLRVVLKSMSCPCPLLTLPVRLILSHRLAVKLMELGFILGNVGHSPA